MNKIEVYIPVIICTIVCIACISYIYLFITKLKNPSNHESNAHIRTQGGYTDTPKGVCINCGSPVYRQGKKGSWVHQTFSYGGYTSCADHKRGYVTSGPGGPPYAEVDKNLFPDSVPIVYLHHIELKEPIDYHDVEDYTRITFSKEFKGHYAMKIHPEETMSKNILFDFTNAPVATDWFDIYESGRTIN